MICDLSPLEVALRRLETALETPVVAGEMSYWCTIAVNACRDLGTELDRSIDGRHAALLKEIVEFDPEQAVRVQGLRSLDAELQERTQKFAQRLCKLCEATEKVGADEARVVGQLEESVKVGLQLVIDVRKQELALANWHGEALERDRGVAD